MQVYWVSQDFFFTQKRFKILALKENLFSGLQINIKTLPESFAFCGGLLDNEIVIWAKPGILKEEYILFFECLQPFVKITCNEILSWTFKCIQHALSLKNNTVAPALSALPTTKEISMDDFL